MVSPTKIDAARRFCERLACGKAASRRALRNFTRGAAIGLLVVSGAVTADPEPPAFAGMLEAHNQWRRPVGSPDLQWSDEAARQAQAWADELASGQCQARHSSDETRRQKFGENIYYYWLSHPYQGYRKDPAAVVAGWGREIEYYDEAADDCHAPEGHTCRHYTQVVWSRTTHVGCGRARCDSAEVWVCEYSPRGNVHPVRPYEPRHGATSPAKGRLRPVPATPAAAPPP